MLHVFDFWSILVFRYFKCQYSSHSSIPRTYALGVKRTPNQSDSDVNFFQIVQSRESNEKGLKDRDAGIAGRQWERRKVEGNLSA